MKTIRARNVNNALREGMILLATDGVRESSRAGSVLVAPWPVVTQYYRPQERVLFSPIRDANPFFHLMEALWMLAGRNDAGWLDQFVSDFSARFGEGAMGVLHGAYGYRWRNTFGFDQLDYIVKMLKHEPTSRQAVLQMWDCSDPHSMALDEGQNDLKGDWKDRPCNTHAYFRIRKQFNGKEDESVLDMTVCCRSNDIIWGAYGANAVHFSVLQEYMAARIGVGIGYYYQISNNFHAYVDIFDKLLLKHITREPREEHPPITSIVTCPDAFDSDLRIFFQQAMDPNRVYYANPFFSEVAEPMLWANKAWKDKRRDDAVRLIDHLPLCDWRVAAEQWMQRRMVKE